MPELLKIKDGKILYNGAKMEAFIPSEYFRKNYIEQVGSDYYLLGIFETFHYRNENDERSKAQMAAFQYPLKFFTQPDDSYIEKIDIGHGLDNYTVLVYHRDSVVFTNVSLVKTVESLSELTEMLIGGKLDIMNYSDINRIFQLCKHYNTVDLEIPSCFEEVLIAEFYRDPTNLNKSARFVANENNYYSKGVTEREKVGSSTTFAALTFEDKNSMLTSAVNAHTEGRKEVVTQAERFSLSLK